MARVFNDRLKKLNLNLESIYLNSRYDFVKFKK